MNVMIQKIVASVTKQLLVIYPLWRILKKKAKEIFAYALEIFVIAFGGLMEQSMVLFLPVLQDFGLLLELCVCVSVYINASVWKRSLENAVADVRF